MDNLIDSDVIHYAVGFSIGDGEVEDAYRKVDSFIESIEKATGYSNSRLFINGQGNYRNDILPEYKANRIGKEKPIHHKAIRDYIINNWDAVVVDGEEVDDALGIVQCASEGDTIICSADKDLDCIPGLHYNWSKKRIDDGVYEVSLVEANRFFYTQCLVGDSTDNIPGLKKRTGKIATKKLKSPLLKMDDPMDMYNHIRTLYGAVPFHDVAGCLWIRREKNQMWEPPTLLNQTSANIT